MSYASNITEYSVGSSEMVPNRFGILKMNLLFFKYSIRFSLFELLCFIVRFYNLI